MSNKITEREAERIADGIVAGLFKKESKFKKLIKKLWRTKKK